MGRVSSSTQHSAADSRDIVTGGRPLDIMAVDLELAHPRPRGSRTGPGVVEGMSGELSEADGRLPERGRSVATPKAAGEGAWEFVLLVLILATLAALLRTALQPDFFADEVEHAHVTWLLGQGVMPYRDIHQIHLPMVWILLSPLLSVLPETLESLVILRMVCLLALAGSCAAAWLALDEVIERPTRAHRYSAILMALSVAGHFHFYRYRPDPFMAMFWFIERVAAF